MLSGEVIHGSRQTDGQTEDPLRLLGPAHGDKQMRIRPCTPTRVRLTDTSGGGFDKKFGETGSPENSAGILITSS